MSPLMMQLQLVRGRSARASQSTITRDKQMQEKTSLLHFPDELLLHVIEELGDTELYTLSQVSKRCQRIALPAYLERRGIALPLNAPIDHLTFSAAQLVALPSSALPFVLFATRVRSLFCKIDPVHNRGHTRTDLNDLCRAILGANSLEDIALRFNHSYLIHGAKVCIQLLEVVAQCCTSLQFSDDVFHWGIVQVERPSEELLIEEEAAKWKERPHNQLPSALFDVHGESAPHRLLHSMSTWSSRALRTHTSSERRPSRYALKFLSLRTPAFLLPPYTGLAFRLLNTAPITRLDLVNIHLSSRASAAIFGALTTPILRHLSITLCRFEFNAFAQFLSRHDAISTFEIVYWDMQPLPSSTLPGLVSLKSIPDNLVHLLRSTDVFPRLTQVRVIIRLFSREVFSFSSVESQLARCAKRLMQANTRIGLEVHLLTRTDDRWINEYGALNYSHNPILSRVQEIAFHMPRLHIVANSAIPEWLSSFQLLEDIEILDSPNHHSRHSKITFLRRIVQECVGIRSCTIDEEMRDVAAWLAEEQ